MTVRVVGAPRSGVTSLSVALRGRLAGRAVVENEDACTTGGLPTVVLAACSAVAPLTASDCAGIDAHARSGDVVIGVLTKVDAHRGWRAVLAANRAAMATFDPRYRDLTWVCVAAAPDVGAARLDDLVAEVCHPSPRPIPKALQRNMSRERSNRAAGVALRDELQRQRIRLGRRHRRRCTELRTGFRDRALRASRAQAADLGAEFERAAQEVLDDLRDRIGAGLGDLAELLGVAAPVPAPCDGGAELPPLPSGGGAAESRLTLALGAGFGLGVAATVGRIVAAMAPSLAVAGATVAVLVGCVLTAWLVSTRALLQRRATLDRWVTEAAAAVRSQGEEMIADTLLAARTDWTRRAGP